MKPKILELIDFEKVDNLLEGFNQSTGFVTAILDLEGNVLSKSGWRQICTQFHRVHPATSKMCTISDTELANRMGEGEKYHFYQCLNGLVDVAVPIVIKGEHIANLFSGQFFFEKPDKTFFQEQAAKYKFDSEIYMKALGDVPVVSKEKVKLAMDFLLNMTQMISEMTFQKLEQMELNEAIQKNERILRLFVEHSPASIAMFDNNMRYLVASHRFLDDYNLGNQNLIGRSHYDVFPEITEGWKEIHRRCLAGETISESNDPFPRADGKTDWVRWEIRPWYESGNDIGGIILFSEVITAQIEDRFALKESEKYNRMLFEQSAIGLALTSFDGKLVDINSTFSNIIGRTVAETKSLTYWDLTPEKYKNQEQQQLDLLAKTGRYGPYEKEYIHKDGHLVPVRLQGLIIERNNEKFIWSSVEDISERKQSEKALQQAKDYSENLIATANVIIIGLDTAGNIEVFNQTAERITGYTLADLAGKNWFEILAPRNKYPKVWAEFGRLLSGGFPQNFENPILTKSGEERQISWKNNEIWKDGQICGIISFGIDITERKQSEEALHESEERFRKAFEEAPLGIAMASLTTGKLFSTNKELCEMLEYTEEEFQQLTFLDITYPDDRATDIEVINNLIEDRILKHVTEKRYIRKNGEIIWGLRALTKINNSEGKPDYVLAMIKDITDRKIAEVDLKRISQIMSNSQEIAHLGSFEYVAATQTTVWSEEEYRIYGLDPSGPSPEYNEMLKKCIHPNDAELLHNTFMAAMQRQGIYELEHRIVRPDGIVRWVHDKANPYFDEKGNLLRYIGTTLDITERKLLQQELEILNADLEKKVEQRTAELVSANKELETFTYSVSHDLKAPLRGIDGYSKLLIDLYGKNLDEEANTFLATIRNSTLQMNQLIEDLLEYSRLERSLKSSEKIKIKELVNSATSVYMNELNALNFSLIVEMPDIEIIADSKGFTIALRNLIENAIKFTKQRPDPQIEIRLEEKPSSWVLQVKDNGIGFDMKYHQRIFEIFQRLHRAEDFDGTGIGLAMVSKAMQRMGGRAWAESTPGIGSTFYLEIPKSR